MATERDRKSTAGTGFPWKLRGQVAYGLIRDLAEGTQSNARLARKYDVDVKSVANFKAKNAERIAAVAADMENEFAGLWSAEKRRRIAEYEQDVALVNDSIEAQTAWIAELERRVLGTADGEYDSDYARKQLPRAERELGAMLKRKHAALHSIAEEMGQLPSRVNVQITGGEQPVLHQIVGVDPNDL